MQSKKGWEFGDLIVNSLFVVLYAFIGAAIIVSVFPQLILFILGGQ